VTGGQKCAGETAQTATGFGRAINYPASGVAYQACPSIPNRRVHLLAYTAAAAGAFLQGSGAIWARRRPEPVPAGGHKA